MHTSAWRLIDAAPNIDDLLDALVVPAWSGRIGAEIDENLLQPPVPRFTSITSGVSGTDTAGLVDFLIVPGSGSVTTATFTVQHRVVGSAVWQSVTISAAEGGGTLTYATGQHIELQAYATSPGGQNGPLTSLVPLTVGGKDAPIPGALDAAAITVGALLGGAVVQFATSDDAAGAQVQIYRSTVNVLNRATDAAGQPIPTVPSRSYSAPIGDTTRQSLVNNGGFDTDAVWVKGAGWTIASGQSTHATGSATSITQPLAAQAGKFYRTSFRISGVTAGIALTRLSGGSDRSGAQRAANGTFSDRIQAVTGNNTFAIAGSSTFNGSVDDVVVYLETSTCLAQGTHYFWLEPQNADGVPGPVAGPFSVIIR